MKKQAESVIYINPNGHEVLLSPETIQLIKERGEWHKYSVPPPEYVASGPKDHVLLLMNVNGIGDDICAMPAVKQKIADGFKVTVVGREFSRECFETLGAKFINEEETFGGWLKEIASNYGVIISMKAWCLKHEQDTAGYVSQDRFQQAAERIQTTLPAKFSWVKAFKLKKRQPKDYIYYAPKSIAPIRTYNYSGELQSLLSEASEVRYNERKETFRELIEEVYNAKLVVSVDNAILHLALALGVPCVGIFGPTDERFIAEPYERFHPIQFRVARITTIEGCFAPCSAQLGRGYGPDCKKKAKCLTALQPNVVAQTVLSLTN